MEQAELQVVHHFIISTHPLCLEQLTTTTSSPPLPHPYYCLLPPHPHDRSYFKVLSDILLGPGLASISSYQPIVVKLLNKVCMYVSCPPLSVLPSQHTLINCVLMYMYVCMYVCTVIRPDSMQCVLV